MTYALIKDGAVAKHPYSITDLRRDNIGVSFPNNPSADVLKAYGVEVVFNNPAPDVPVQQVLEETTPVFSSENQRWEQVWTVRDKTQAEIDVAASQVRAERNDKLTATDWTQVADAPVDKAAWATYRQALRDITTQAGFPWEVSWPVAP